jgi:hypothetical protein
MTSSRCHPWPPRLLTVPSLLVRFHFRLEKVSPRPVPCKTKAIDFFYHITHWISSHIMLSGMVRTYPLDRQRWEVCLDSFHGMVCWTVFDHEVCTLGVRRVGDWVENCLNWRFTAKLYAIRSLFS